MIPIAILEKYNATLKTYSKGEVVFRENELAQFYFQIKMGKLKMFNHSVDGKAFIQGFFEAGKSFGEPPLFQDSHYPACSQCITDCEIYILAKESFFELLANHPKLHLALTKILCKRMIYKAKIIQELSIHPPEHRILTLLNHFKEATNTTELYEVKFTRQQISDMTGLRVETVIRTIKQLEKDEKLILKRRKVFL
ncbi:Crp/Fnr family transcriptional regulator [Bizionia argentinensis JUB59]|uniref:Crp/Fnr family transcriptional regulator n=1 Tax=Bizionia argentinensis JUB59 TaxID=1046627 RepID=G2ECI3_9FLAO|nr:Crp/Fnr family transcriptional regulator [Bizionia argentinensis]EGV43865.1 Crp/Fnr family transcriptional regulator [Bizionia argentinensis JUB59]